MLYIYCNIAYIIVLLNQFINMILYKLMLQTVNKNSNIKNSDKYTTILNYNFSTLWKTSCSVGFCSNLSACAADGNFTCWLNCRSGSRNERGSSSFSSPRVYVSVRHRAGVTLSCADGFPFSTLRTGQRRCQTARCVKPLGKPARRKCPNLAALLENEMSRFGSSK